MWLETENESNSGFIKKEITIAKITITTNLKITIIFSLFAIILDHIKLINKNNNSIQIENIFVEIHESNQKSIVAYVQNVLATIEIATNQDK